jgi:hypothetical protein
LGSCSFAHTKSFSSPNSMLMIGMEVMAEHLTADLQHVVNEFDVVIGCFAK